MISPPAILIAWSADDNYCRATAIVAADLEPIGVWGPSTSLGVTPARALDALLGRRFGILVDQDCPATLVTIGTELPA